MNIGRVALYKPIKKSEVESVCRAWLIENRLHHIITLNPEMVVRAQNDKDFRDAVNRADLSVPDGIGILMAHEYLLGIRSFFLSLLSHLLKKQRRITGTSIIYLLAALASETDKTMYLLGGLPGDAERTASTLIKRYPGLKIRVGPPHTYHSVGSDEILYGLNKCKPDILFVAYGSPAQTMWIERNRVSLPSVKIAAGIGGAFATISGRLPSAPAWMKSHGLEWLWRLALEPKRLPRIMRATIIFPLIIARQKHAWSQTSSARKSG